MKILRIKFTYTMLSVDKAISKRFKEFKIISFKDVIAQIRKSNGTTINCAIDLENTSLSSPPNDFKKN